MASKKDIVKFDMAEIRLTAMAGGKLVLTQEAESQLVKFLDFCQKIDALKEHVKNELQKSGNEVMAGFRGMEGSKVRVMVREYGSKYDADARELPDELTYTTRRADTLAIDTYVQEKGKLPKGVTLAKRDKILSISLKD